MCVLFDLFANSSRRFFDESVNTEALRIENNAGARDLPKESCSSQPAEKLSPIGLHTASPSGSNTIASCPSSPLIEHIDEGMSGLGKKYVSRLLCL